MSNILDGAICKNSERLKAIFTKRSIVDVLQGSEYASVFDFCRDVLFNMSSCNNLDALTKILLPS